MWNSRPLLLILLFAVIGGLAWWWSGERGDDASPQGARQRVPDYVVTDLVAIETNDDGRPNRRLEADVLRQFIDEDLAELDRPRLALFQPDGPPWLASARQGWLLNGDDELRLRDEVRISRTAPTPEDRPVQLDTDQLTIWPARQYAEGDQPVRITSGADWLTAAGLRLWYASPMRADFPGRAHISLTPAPTDSPPTESPP